MKFLFITEFFPTDDALQFSGGVEAHNFYLFKELAKKHQVTVICRFGSGQATQKNNWNIKIIRVGAKTNRIDTNYSTIPSRFLFMYQSFTAGRGLEFDLVQGNNFVSYPSAFLLGFIKKKPSIAWYPDVFIGEWMSLVGLISGVVGEISERLSLIFPWTHIISLSNSTTGKLIKQKIDSQKITTIHGGVDFDYFSKIKASKQKIFTICCIARLVSYKRVDLLLKAAAILKKRKVNFKLVIIGQGPEDFSLKLLAQNLDIEDKVFFRSNINREELAKNLKSSDLFCLPSEQEGFGLVVMEAASAGLPFVISDIPVFQEITENGKGGLLFKKGDAQDLANKINRLITDHKLYQKLALEAFELAKQYRWEYIAGQFEKVYFRILRKPIKVVMLIDAWFPHVGGGQVHALELAKGLNKIGYEVTILSRNLGKYINDSELKIVLIGKQRPFADGFGRIEYLFLALIYCLRHNFDIYHAHAFSPGLLIPFIKLFKKGKTVFTVHGKGAKVAGFGLSLNFLEDLVVYKIVYDLEISVAKSTIVKKVAAKKLVIIPNGVEIEKFVSAVRKRAKIKNILYVGRLSFEKGVDLLIKAFREIPQNNFNLTIVGEGVEIKSLKKLASNKNIEFKGRLDGTELVKEYKKADLLVLPSRTEGQPLTLFEAWASKLPILATRVGDNSNYIKNGVNGFLVNPDRSSIEHALEEAGSSKNLPEISENGYRKVKKYSWQNIVELTDSAYKGII